MLIHQENYSAIQTYLNTHKVTLVAVSKTKSVAAIQELYDLGQRDFGENYVQELVDKYAQLPKDIRWHFIGHLQTNKVKLIAPFVYLIHGVDSAKLLKEIEKQALKINRKINCLLQMYIAAEETKFGMEEDELQKIMEEQHTVYPDIAIRGLMGMASFTTDENKLNAEFSKLQSTFLHYAAIHKEFNILSSGMSADYKLAVNNGSNLVRIGSLLFGSR